MYFDLHVHTRLIYLLICLYELYPGHIAAMAGESQGLLGLDRASGRMAPAKEGSETRSPQEESTSAQVFVTLSGESGSHQVPGPPNYVE